MLFLRKSFGGLALAGLVAFSVACGGVKTDPDVDQAIKAVVENCKIETRYGNAENCADKEDEKLDELIEEKGQAASLGSLAVALGAEDEETRSIAADRLYDNFRSVSDLEKNPESIDKAAVDLLIENLGKYEEYGSFYAARSAAFLAMLTGKQDKLYAMLDSHPNDAVQTEGYGSIMRYGRLAGFPKVKELVASGDEKIAGAVAYAPRDMYNYTDEEKQEVCEWAVGNLQHENERVAAASAQILALRCQGEYIDKMLDEAERRAEADELKRPFASALTNFTFSCQSAFGSDPTGSEEQCKRKEELKARIQ